jgi:hypothetical protein
MSTTRHARGEVVRPVTLVPTKFQHCPFFFHPSADHPPVRVSLSAVTCTSHLLPECVQILATSWSFHLCCYLSCCPVCVLLIYTCSHVSVCNHFCTGSLLPGTTTTMSHPLPVPWRSNGFLVPCPFLGKRNVHSSCVIAGPRFSFTTTNQCQPAWDNVVYFDRQKTPFQPPLPSIR